MTTERAVRALAGSLVLVGVILAWQVHPAWLVLVVLVGLNLLQSAFTGICPAEKVFRRLGLPSCAQSPTQGQQGGAPAGGR